MSSKGGIQRLPAKDEVSKRPRSLHCVEGSPSLAYKANVDCRVFSFFL